MPLYILISLTLLLAVCGFSHMIPRVDPLVDSKLGLIRGLRATDGDYSMFLGIPYAKVDEDNLFGDSLPYPKFEETFEAFDDTSICPQVDEFNKTIVGTLDCLHLNVFVPTEATSENRLPVLVWIYGGGFDIGFHGRYLYGPKFLVRHGVLLITLNYRLGPYGFMCTDIPEVSGNQGLKDQLTALRWIKENIEAFGGDPNKITIFGESAGAASVDYHLHSPQENPFHQVIMQSGVLLIPDLMQNPGVEGPLKLAEHLGLVTNDVKEALTFLATVDTRLVIAATTELGLKFRPCVEKNFEGVDQFLEDYPVNLKTPKVKNMPILIGFNNDEALSFTHSNVEKDIRDSINASFDMDSETFDEMSKILEHFYFGDEDIKEEIQRSATDLNSDFRFVYPTSRSLTKYYNNGAESIFTYMFSFVSERNFAKYRSGITIGGASHADEISYVFDVSYMRSVMSDEEQTVVDRITTMWTNFVKYGNPTPEITELLPVKWTPATKDRWNYLKIDQELAMETRPFSERMAFLDLFFKLNEKQQIGYKSVE